MKNAEVETEYNKLQNDVNTLTSKINQTFSLSEKQHLQTLRRNMTATLNGLQDKLDAERNTNAWNNLLNTLKQRSPYIVLEVNSVEIEIPENLIVEFSYSGCKHKQKIHLAEFLRYRKTVNSNIQLLNEWQPIISQTTEIGGRWWCEECRKEKDSLRAKFFRYNDKEAGQAQWRIKHFNLKAK
jgi:ElaB/YqjD/DUF883 family membrane-anchored ribosome-binding protein